MAEPQELQDFLPVLKNVYLPIRKKAFPLMTPLLANARRGSAQTVRYAGNDLFFDVKLGRRGGFVSSASGFTPESVIAREKQGRLSIARTYAKVFVDGLALAASRQQRGSYISAARKHAEDVMEEWQLEQERQLQGDSLGIRCTVTNVTSTTVIDVENPYGITGAGPGNLQLSENDTIQVLTADGTTARGKAKISSITLSGDTATLTLASAIASMAATDIVVTAVPASVDASDSSFGADAYGLKAIMDVENAFATFEGIKDDRWVATKIVSSSVDETIVMRGMNLIMGRAGVDWRTDPRQVLLITTMGIEQQYGESLLGLRRFAPRNTIRGGFTGVQVANATLVPDPWAPRGRLYGVHTRSTLFIDLLDFGIVSQQGAPTWQRAPNRDGWEALYATYWNYGVTMRNSHFVISGITDTQNYSPVY